MKKVKLHLEISPIIGYSHHSYHLMVAQEHPSFQKWFNTNYIQLKYYPETNWINFYRFPVREGTGQPDFCPLLDYQLIKNTMLKISKLDFIEFMINAFDNRYYVWLFIDEFFDPNRRSYNKRHFNHEGLLYGYDADASYFNAVGFDHEQKFAFTEIPFPNFLDAFTNIKDELPIKLLKPNNAVNYELDIENVKNLLKDYLNSENTSIRTQILRPPSSDCVYGLEVYKHLKHHLEEIIKTISHCDSRIFHIFWEHKKCMLSRIEYLIENKYLQSSDSILDSYKDIERKVYAFRNQSFEYNLSGNSNIIKKMIVSLDDIADNESKVLTKLLECLQ